tara:strand:+ start:603 stop:935 length:333 start_codon:yes stop_codon:yes gene_type:complete
MARRWDPNKKRYFRPTDTDDYKADKSRCAACSKNLDDFEIMAGNLDETGRPLPLDDPKRKEPNFCVACAHLRKFQDKHGLVRGTKTSRRFRGYQTDSDDRGDPPPGSFNP